MMQSNGFDPFQAMMFLKQRSQMLGAPSYVQNGYDETAQNFAPQQEPDWRQSGLRPMYADQLQSYRGF